MKLTSKNIDKVLSKLRQTFPKLEDINVYDSETGRSLVFFGEKRLTSHLVQTKKKKISYDKLERLDLQEVIDSVSKELRKL